MSQLFLPKYRKKDLTLALAAALVFTLFFSLAGFDQKCQPLRDNILRLHIIAHSDSAKDQAVKYAVRDRLLSLSDGLYEKLTNKEQAIAQTNAHLTEWKKAAEETVRQNGGTQAVSISVGKAYFGTRVYENFTLPAGEYDAVRVKIGEANGKNWWCVMFPTLCIPAAGAPMDLQPTVPSDSAEIAKNASRYEMRFKAVEIIQSMKRKWDKLF